jgi:OOP family OmpA-OmpF porin
LPGLFYSVISSYARSTGVRIVLAVIAVSWVFASAKAQSTAESERVKRPVKIRKLNLGNDVNSNYSELAPIISADGQLLFFTMGQGYPANLGEDKLQDCYVCRRLPDGRWSQPTNLGYPINSSGNDAISGVSTDGAQLFIRNFAHNRLSGLCFARYIGKAGWRIDSITIDGYQNDGAFTTQCLSTDSKYIIFSLERPDSYGKSDLYVSERLTDFPDHFGKPKNLGPAINSGQEEFAPFLAPDGVTLYFSSKGHRGFGDADVFVSKRLDDSWTNWSIPKNLGPEINTSGMDAYYSVPASGDLAYCSSSNGVNHLDIYVVTLDEDVRPNPVLLITGRVSNREGQPLAAEVTYRHRSTDSVSTIAFTNPQTGLFAAVLPNGQVYGLEVQSTSYLPYVEELNLSDAATYKELRMNIVLDSAVAGGAITLRDVFFDFDRAELRVESHFELDRVTALLKQRGGWHVRIEGYTDSTGDQARNLELSRHRAESVLAYLVQAGLDSHTLEAVGYGSADPVADNSTIEGRRANRRVVLRLSRP